MTEMNDNNEQSFTRSRVKKNSNKVLYLFIVTILALTGGFFFYQKNIESFEQRNSIYTESSTNQESKNSSPIGKDVSTADSPQLANSNIIVQNSNQQTQSKGVISDTTASSTSLLENETVTNTGVGQNPLEKTTLNSLDTTVAASGKDKVEYKVLISELNSFYTHLDSQAYMKDFKLPEPSKEHFSKLIQKLIDNPPVVTRETDDLFTLLKNTAHFFRIIGKDNILVLKGILDREKDSFESVLQSLYVLTKEPDLLKEQYGITLDSNALYDYAGFFLNTMGGRLYLFRRDSNSRLAVSYYSISIIDNANDTGNSRHGIDIRPAVDSLIDEIENGGKNLRLREHYLDTLYDLKVKYD